MATWLAWLTLIACVVGLFTWWCLRPMPAEEPDWLGPMWHLPTRCCNAPRVPLHTKGVWVCAICGNEVGDGRELQERSD